jgi:transcriptional regulator with XRE-family HTH domain
VINLKIGQNIKKYRKEKKLTQPELGLLIGKSESSIRKYESGDVVPSMDIITKIVDALDINFFALLNGVDIEFERPKDEELERKNKISNVVLSVEKKMAVNRWVKNSNLKEIIEDVITTNIELEGLQNNIKALSTLEEIEFRKINDIPLESYNLYASVVLGQHNSTLINNIVTKILFILNLEEDKLSDLLKSKKQ